MAAKTMTRYTLKQFDDIIFNGFNYTVPAETSAIIANLARQVGSPGYDKTPVFKKRDATSLTSSSASASAGSVPRVGGGSKRKGNRSMEITNDDEWETLRTPFQTTKLEAKTGIDGEFDTIRSFINKMTDKNYIDMRNKIVEVLDRLVEENSDADLGSIGANIFEVASSNRYYSKMYADLYSDLSEKYSFIRDKYTENLSSFVSLFATIEYVDPNENYDRFCEINKMNEKRKAFATFYLNLMKNGVIAPHEIVTITRNLLANVYHFISVENKKNEVEELTETIALLYVKNLYDGASVEFIDGMTIPQVIERIAKSKTKDYKSLTNKALFKFMDLIDM